MNMKTILSTRAALCLALACMGGPALAQGVTDVANVPLATSGGRSILPNLLIDLDDSGSMGWDFLPDYVSPNTNGSAQTSSRPCMFDKGKNGGFASEYCYAGDPPYAAGGQNAMNGVAYDPNFRYTPGVGVNGQPLLNPPAGLPLNIPVSTTKVVADMYASKFGTGSSTVDLAVNIPDVQYCNSPPTGTAVCKRPGADTTGAVVTGTMFDSAGSAGITMLAGQFPYRTNPSNSSKAAFGLPEMMSIGTLVRGTGSGTVTVTTIEPHGLATNDRVYVTSGTSSMNVNCAAVTMKDANTFTYDSGTSGTSNITGTYRKCLPGTWALSSGTVKVTTTAGDPGLVPGDAILVVPGACTPTPVTFPTPPNTCTLSTTTVAVTAADTSSFSYAAPAGSGTAGTTTGGSWVRTGLYNTGSQKTGPAIAYAITPLEYCSDFNLTNCAYVPPGSTAPAGFDKPAYVRYCLTQDQALANGAVSDASGTPRCRSKYNEETVAPLYIFPRFGLFQRDTIVTGLTFNRSSARSDCATPTKTTTAGVTTGGCTYDEELNNYATWYTYYRTRLQMMKSAVGISFVPFIGAPSGSPPKPNAIRIGFVTMHAQDSNSSNTIDPNGNKYLKIADFDITQATSFYSRFYANTAANGTPLQQALSRAGWIYAGKLGSGLTAGLDATHDPIQAACQRNYTLLTTDGFWNGLSSAPPLTPAGKTITNLDATPVNLPSPNGNVLVDRSLTVTLDGSGATTTVLTPNATQQQQVLCQGTKPANFTIPGANPANCGCTDPKQHEILEQDVASTTKTVFVNGVQDNSQTKTTQTPSLTTVAACVEGNWQETDQDQSSTAQAVCGGKNTVNFSDGGQFTCNCSNKQFTLVTETTTQTQTVITTDGVQTQNNITNINHSYVATACSTTKPTITLSPNPQPTVPVGLPRNSSAPGTTLAFTLNPNPGSTPGGPPTSTFSGAGTPSTVADTALYYFQTPLRGGKDVYGSTTGPGTGQNTNPPNTVDLSTSSIPVKAGAKDFVAYQHMVTFGIGLTDGFMRYQADYPTATSGDFFNIQNGTPGACFWTAGTCNWPIPSDNTSGNLDDLWHAAVNGRGTYFQALNADALSKGLSNVLASVNAQVASASASATSSPNVTQTDNQIFSTTYETNTWSGSVFAQKIDPVTGNVLPTIQWQADGQLVTKANLDQRNIFTFDVLNSAGTNLKAFRFSSLDPSAEQPFFAPLCPNAAGTRLLSNCSSLSGSDLAAANDGNQVVNFLRGDSSNEDIPFRDRQLIDPITGAITQTVLGDTVNAKPVFVRNPILTYTDAVTPNYATFAFNNANRAPRVYVAANDGFLHAFDGDTGDESWAYAPRFLFPKMYLLADVAYSQRHQFFVDGSPETFDVFDKTAGAWKTILIGGAGAGGRGFYALDITDPVNPKGLWEFCVDPNLCAIHDDDLGFAWGNPIVGKRPSDGRWVAVVTSGLNNIPDQPGPPLVPLGKTGSGAGFFYVLDAITGAVLNKVPTGVGTVTAPSGLMKQSAFYNAALTDATMQFIYGGDQLGNVWRLDLGSASGACDPPATGSAPCISHLATLTDGSSPTRVQPITTRPQLTVINNSRVIYVGTGRYLGMGLNGGVSDLLDPGTTSGIAWLQSLYAIKDRNFDYGTTLRTSAAVVKQTLSLAGTSNRNVTKNPVNFATNDGWMVDFISLTDDPSGGERVNIDPRLVLGTLVVVTNTPAGGGACSVGGTSRQYNFDYLTGGYVGNIQTPVGLSLGGTIAVGMAIVQLPSNSLKDIITGADTSKTTSDVPPNSGGNSLKRFSYRER